jgi:hypothetical protein
VPGKAITSRSLIFINFTTFHEGFNCFGKDSYFLGKKPVWKERVLERYLSVVIDGFRGQLTEKPPTLPWRLDVPGAGNGIQTDLR